MKENFSRSYAAALKEEGGFSNHPKDPGGATMRGVTQRVYDAYRINKGEYKQTVRKISDAEVRDIFKRQYWDAVKADELPAGVDYAVFDFAINSGPSRAVKELQRIVGETQDGVIGHRTIAAAARHPDKQVLIDAYQDRRRAFVRSLITHSTFGKGWEARIKRVRDLAKQMARGQSKDAQVSQDHVGHIVGKADPAAVAITKTSEGKAGALAGVGVAGSAITDAAAQISVIKDYAPALQWVFIALTLAGVSFGLYMTFKRLRSTGE